MHALLMSGLGITYKNSYYYERSLFRDTSSQRAKAILAGGGATGLRMSELTYETSHGRESVLRPPDPVPHLTTFTLESILQRSAHGYSIVRLEDIWEGNDVSIDPKIDVVLLSTTYIWNRAMLTQVMDWIKTRLPGVPIVAGGQYTNLKYMLLMGAYPDCTAVIRGDAEVALPKLLDTLQVSGNLAAIPNLVWRDGDRIVLNKHEYTDIDAFPSPALRSTFRVAPYESMRGCPFDCKFCSFPAASPKWRYKSAEKVRNDWVSYAEDNGVSYIEAMDSTFTVPPTRLRELFQILPGSGIPSWSCFSRANVIDSQEFVDRLVESHCGHVEIGFESMNDETLKRMSKRVTVKQNRRAFELLSGGDLGYGTCFIIGYPGETPEHFEDTRRFLVDEFSGRFSLHLFSISDETMPLWEDRDELQITVEDPYDPDSAWSHRGMSSDEARQLQLATLDEIRCKNDRAVVSLWQREYQRPLVPILDRRANLAVEKALDRLAMAPHDYSRAEDASECVVRQLDVLRTYGIELRSGDQEVTQS